MSAEPQITSVEHQGFTILSNSGTEESVKESLGIQETEPDLSKAASELGKKGGKAAAEKRAAEREAQEEAEEAKPEEPEAKDEPKKDKKGNPRHDPTARVAEATREAKEAREQLARERQEREQLARRLAALEAREKPEAKPEPKGDPEPQEEEFENYRDYVKAQARWEARQVAKEELESERKKASEMAVVDAGHRRFMQHTHAFRERLGPDAEAVQSFTATLHPEIQELEPSYHAEMEGRRVTQKHILMDAVMRAHNPRELLTHLSENFSEFQRLATLQSPQEILWETARIASRLDAATAGASAKPEVSRAKPPVRPVTGAPHIAEEAGFRPGMSFDEYARKWKPSTRR